MAESKNGTNRDAKKFGTGADVPVTAFLFVSALGMYVFFFNFPCFATNDDVMLKAIVSGEITGVPDAHLIYIMFPLGLILKTLYTVWKSVPWYDILMSGVHLLAYFLVMVRTGFFFRKSKPFTRIFVTLSAGFLFAALDYKYLVLHQYTSLAATLAAVALFWVMTEAIRKEGQSPSANIVAGILLILTLWMRKQVFLLSLPLFVLAFLYRTNGKFKLKRLLFPAVIGIITVLSVLTDRMAYQDSEWQAFNRYNADRTDVYDYYMFPEYGEHAEEYRALGIEETDMFPLGEWDLAFFENYKKDSMHELAEFTGNTWKELHYQKWEIRHTAKNVINRILHQEVQPLGIVLTILSLFAPVMLFILKKKKAAVTVLLSLLYEGAVVTYFTFRTRFPERVSYGLYLMVFVFITSILITETEEYIMRFITGKTLIATVLAGVVMAAGAVRIGAFLPEYKAFETSASEWSGCNEYFNSHPENVYYLKTSSFAPYGEKMFRKNTYESGNFLRMGTWIMGSPLYDAQVSRRGVKPPEGLISGDGIYYVQDSIVNTEWIPAFYEGHGRNVNVTEADRIRLPDGKEFSVLSIRETVK